MTDEKLQKMLATVDGVETIELLLRSLYYNPVSQGFFSSEVDDYTTALRELVSKVQAAKYTGQLNNKSVDAVWLLLDREQKEERQKQWDLEKKKWKEFKHRSESTPADWERLSNQLAQERRLIEATEKLEKLCRELQGEAIPES